MIAHDEVRPVSTRPVCIPARLPDLEIELIERGAIVTLNRAEKSNAVRAATIASLIEALGMLEEMDEVRALVLTGAGTQAFSAGADMAEFARFSLDEIRSTMWGGWRSLIRRIDEYPKPVIAAINGYAVGGGLEIASVCHLRIASTTAQLGLPEITHGHLPGAGGLTYLPRLLPRAMAAHCLLTGELFDAQRALAVGFVSHVFEPSELRPAAVRIVQRLGGLVPLALDLTLRALAGGRDGSIDAALALERTLSDQLMQHGEKDMYEGFHAFAQRKIPAS